MRFEQKLPGVKVWINGREISDGNRLHFGKGNHNLLVEVEGRTFPADGLLSPRLFASPDPAAELATWQKFIDRVKPYLDRVIELAPDSKTAKRAQAVINSR